MPVVEDSHYDAILKHRFKSHTFVETGTALGYTAEYMSGCFDQVYSVEYDEDLHWSAFQRLRSIRNLHLIRGDSAEYLPKIDFLVPPMSTFFLDAHSVDNPNSSVAPSGYTPVERELEVVLNIKRHVVLVDDARLFDGSEYPTLHQVRELAEQRYFNMSLEGDIIVLKHKGGPL